MISIAARAIPISVVDDEAVAGFSSWLQSGANAGMAYMENWPELRRDPEGLLPGARTMITLAIPFPLPPGGAPSGCIASYALGLDYHDLIRNLFKPALQRLTEKGIGEWRLCVDSAPVMERYWAVKSGLGHPTLSGMVSVDGFGTACFLFELLTTATLEQLNLTETPAPEQLNLIETPTPEQLSLIETVPLTATDLSNLFGIEAKVPHIPQSNAKPSECTQCGRCQKACPTGALSPCNHKNSNPESVFPGMGNEKDGTGRIIPGCNFVKGCSESIFVGNEKGGYESAFIGGRVDSRSCLSYLTIEHRGPFETPEAIRAMSTVAGRKTLFGCDRCVTACPLNRPPYRNQEELSILPGLQPHPARAALTKERCAAMTQEEFAATFKGTPIKRAKLEGLRRNAAHPNDP